MAVSTRGVSVHACWLRITVRTAADSLASSASWDETRASSPAGARGGGSELVSSLSERVAGLAWTWSVFEYVGGLSISLSLSQKAEFAFADFLHCLPVSSFSAFCSHFMINFL